jgi:hypothetical protein
VFAANVRNDADMKVYRKTAPTEAEIRPESYFAHQVSPLNY